MTDEPAGATRPETDRSPPRAEIMPADFARKRDYLPLLYLLGFVVLAGSLVYLWQNPPASKLSTQESVRVDTLQSQIAGLRGQVARLEGRPAGASEADFAKLQAQVNGLEGRPAVAPAAVAALSAKVGALESRPTVDSASLQSLSDKVATLQSQKVVTPEQLSLLSDQVQKIGRDVPDIKPLDQKVAALEQRPTFDPAATNGRFSELSAKLQGAVDAGGKLGKEVDTLNQQQAALADQLKTLTQKAQITARLQGMATALAAGQKLGDIPGAPPALARFATEAPPTEASLRESFDRYADAAQRASQPAITDKQDFGARLWTRAQQAVTVRQGDRVLVGDPIAGVMARAREKLENGDLAGSVEALKGLAGPAAAAMGPWTEKAQALVAARSAIAGLAAG